MKDEALKQALAAPVQEPVGLAQEVIGCFDAAESEGLTEALDTTTDDFLKDLVERRLMYALYAAQKATTPPAAQRQWVGLSEQEVWDAVRDTVGIMPSKAFRVYQAIETVLKEKNT